MPDRSVSPSLVEAAARALVASRGTERWYAELGRGRRPREGRAPTLVEMEAEAVLVAVGDALRLEGAQAERERIVADESLRTIQAAVAYYGCDVPIEVFREGVLAVLGGVHPEASDG